MIKESFYEMQDLSKNDTLKQIRIAALYISKVIIIINYSHWLSSNDLWRKSIDHSIANQDYGRFYLYVSTLDSACYKWSVFPINVIYQMKGFNFIK